MSKGSQQLMFILDLDGTILFDHSTILPETINTIKIAKDQGHTICLVTGRPTAGAIEFHNALELDTLMGTLNGNSIYDPISRKTTILSSVNSNLVTDLLKEKGDDFAVDFAVQLNGKIYSTHNKIEIMEKWYHNRSWDIISYDKLPEKVDCAFIIIEESNCDAIEKFFQEKDEVSLHKWEHLENGNLQVYEIFNSDHSKGTMVDYLANHYKIDLENVYIFGDGRNDISMFVGNQNTYAMANAHPELKEVAKNFLKETHKENAVGIAIEKILKATK